jgi:hypothetical protein
MSESKSARGRPSLAIVAVALLTAGAASAAQPIVNAMPPTIVNNVTQVPGSCTNYNSSLTASGVTTPSGATHPGNCRYTELGLLLNGVPAQQFAQSVKTGSQPLPYTAKISGNCIVADNIKIDVSARIDTSLLNWPHARPPQSICGVQWSQHDPAQLLRAATLSAYVQGLLGRSATSLKQTLVANPPEVCGFRPQLARPALAQAFATLLSQFATRAQANLAVVQPRFEAPVESACAVDCNLCGPGWAGRMTLEEKWFGGNGNPGFEFDLVEQYSVGGGETLSNGQSLYPVTWTATGPATVGGTQPKDGGGTGNYRGALNATLPGTCFPPLGTPKECMQVYTDGAGTHFVVYNAGATAPAYVYTSTGNSGTAPASQSLYGSQLAPPGQTTLSIQAPNPPTCGDKPPAVTGGTLYCTQSWTGQLDLLQ